MEDWIRERYQASVDPKHRQDTLTLYDVWEMPIVYYNRWVYQPKPRRSRVVLLPGALDALTKCPWYVVLVFWVVALALFILPERSLLSLLPFFPPIAISYWFLWPLVEHTLHEVVFHRVPSSHPEKLLHFLLHGVHHVVPSDGMRLVMPVVASVPIATAIWLGLWFVTAGSLDVSRALLAGVILGYIQYDMTHYALHAFTPKQFESLLYKWVPLESVVRSLSARFASLHRNHSSHHFVDHQRHFEVSFLPQDDPASIVQKAKPRGVPPADKTK